MPTQPNFTELAAKALLERKGRLVSALAMFRPTLKQDEFFRAMTADQLLEIAVTGRNRGGKSVAVAVWFASVVLDEPVTMRNGDKLFMRPERWRGQELLCWLVGYDWKHNGETIYRLLFRAGLFKIIRDAGQWRSFDPVLDKERKADCKPAPPLIPESAVVPESWSWESKKDRQLQSVALKKDGTRLVFYASTGEVAAGNPVHVIWVDEKINSDGHYAEWLMRLVDYDGRIAWSSWPTLSPSGVFSQILERATDQRDSALPPTTLAFAFRKGDNPYTENATLDTALATMTEEEAAARGDGVVDIGRWMVYPRFSAHVHRVMGDDPSGDDPLAKAIREKNSIPLDWTRYLILDPGTENCGIIKVAVPPQKLGNFVVPYWEYYLHRKDADEVIRIVKEDSAGEVFEDFVIDWHAGRITPMNFSGSIKDNFEKSLSKFGFRNQRRGAHFRFSDDNVLIRRAKLNGMMNCTEKGYPRLRIMNCPQLVLQLSRCRLSKDPLGNPTEERYKYQKNDLVDCMEYAATMDDMIYVPSRSQAPETQNLVTILRSMMKQYGIKPEQVPQTVFCGPGRAPS